jgi:hypothetical protein
MMYEDNQLIDILADVAVDTRGHHGVTTEAVPISADEAWAAMAVARATRRQRSLWCGMAVALLVCGGCSEEYHLRSLAVNEAETISKLPSGLSGIALYVPLQDVPSTDCTLEVTLSDDVNGSWRLIRAVVQEYSETEGRWPDAIFAPICHASARGRPSSVDVCDLYPNTRYRVKLSLEPMGDDITDYFNTPAGPAKDAKLDCLYGKYCSLRRSR